MADQGNGEGGRWDVGANGGAVYLERRSEDDEQLLRDTLEPAEARELAALLNKFADKAESADEGVAGQQAKDDDDSDGDDDHDDDDDDDQDSDDDGDDESEDASKDRS